MKEHISASGIKKYADCPKQWWFRYLSDIEATKQQTEYADLGLAVHEALEAELDTYGMDINCGGVLARYRTLCEAHGVIDDFVDDGEEYCRTAVDYLQKKNDELAEGIEVVDVEPHVPFDLQQSGIDEPVEAYIDLVCDVDGKREIWDWKTGRIRDDTPRNEKIQGGVYVAGHKAKYGFYPDRVRFLYLKEEEARLLNPEDDVAEVMIRHARNLIQGKGEGRFPAKPGGLCYWCGWEFHCDASPVGCGDVEWSEYRW